MEYGILTQETLFKQKVNGLVEMRGALTEY